MIIGMEPACDVIAGQVDITSGHLKLNNRTNNNSISLTMQEGKRENLSKGNRCGHDKNNLRKPIFHKTTKRSPYIIAESRRRLSEAVDFRNDMQLYPGLRPLLRHQNNKRSRKRRSEAVEGALSLTVDALIYGFNINTMAYGMVNDRNETVYHDYSNLRKVTGLTPWRQKRMIKILKDHDICVVDNIVDENHKHVKTIIRLTDKIFTLLNLEEEFLKGRAKAKEIYDRNQELRDRYLQKLRQYKPKQIMSKEKRKSQSTATNEIADLFSKMKPSYKAYKPANKSVERIRHKLLSDAELERIKNDPRLTCQEPLVIKRPPPS